MGITRLGQRGQLVIPKEIRDELGLKAGDFLEVICKEGDLIIKSKKLVDMEDTLTEKEEKLIEESLEQFKRGETISWEQLKNEMGL